MKQLSVDKYIPKKHKNKIVDFYRDSDGCWLELDSNYISVDTETSTIHENTIADIKKKLKTIICRNDFANSNKSKLIK